jgi:hypothetical protein
MRLRGSDCAHCKTSRNQQVSNDAFHGVLLYGRRVSHESNVRNGCLTSIDELLRGESVAKGTLRRYACREGAIDLDG